ncbi:hypothetical protein PSP6_460012 [Paraburkholderia tropica]|uniref:hypothetical protein n=1 Tax=Paraburkholderia tropica TaxID=92647 RepID=UPI001CAABF0E|nr:hypothetical protein [Paraburkholderia tropica]CAG9223684.1 hypothetical protein PSP6_460012 [Paraburkholderia tropica]
MQYTYNIVEVAALWAGVDFSVVRGRMDSADTAEIDREYNQKKFDAECDDVDDEIEWKRERQVCAQCELEPRCPEEVVEYFAHEDLAILQCPQGFGRKPADKMPASRIVKRREWKQRLLPRPGEFGDLPGFEQRLEWLQAALNMGDLDGTPEVVRARDLRVWLEQNFPGQLPEFLFPSANLNLQAHGTPEDTEHQAARGAGERFPLRVVINKLKSKRPDLLAPIIETLVNETGSYAPSIIFNRLREMAMEEMPPLIIADKEYVYWKNVKGERKELSYDSLSRRLRDLRKMSEDQ